jgi:N-acetylneuraminic acid mutarotase
MPWTSETPLLDALNGLAAATCDATSPNPGSWIYAIGGEDINGVVAKVEGYDPIAKTWSFVESMPTARYNLAATSGVGRMYALGGTDGNGAFDAFEIYDPAAKLWSKGPGLPTPRSSLAAVTAQSGKIYAIGGYNGMELGNVEAFDPGTSTWKKTLTKMTTPRYGLAAVVAGQQGYIYAIGGANSTTALDTVEIYNPGLDSWGPGPSLPALRWQLAAAVGPDGLIYAFGGLDNNGFQQADVYTLDPNATNAQWKTLPPAQQLPVATAFLAAATGPDGLIYAIGGQSLEGPQLNTVEAYTIATTSTAPDPYIGNGTYQSPDIIILDSSGNPIPIGGAPGGAWDTLLQPNESYKVQAIIYNDADIPAPNTLVSLWSFPGAVSTAGTKLEEAPAVTVPPNSAYTVSFTTPFQTGPVNAHQCVAITVANAASEYFSQDPTTAPEVIDPTVAHPTGSGHFGSAWRNTNSSVAGARGRIHLIFHPGIPGREPVPVRIIVTTTKVAAGWERTGEPARLTKLLAGSGAVLRLPLFLLPELRAHLPAADLQLEIHSERAREASHREHGRAELHVTLHPGKGSNEFKVSGAIPHDARPGDIFLVNVAAHYPRPQRPDAVVEYLEVIYVR